MQITIVQVGFRGFRGLLILFLASISGAGAVGAVGVWARTLSIQVRMKSWKRSLFDVGAGASSRPGDNLRPRGIRLRVECLKASLPWQARGIVKSRKRRAESGERSGERRQREKGTIFLAFQINWLNRWVRAFRILKAGQLVNY